MENRFEIVHGTERNWVQINKMGVEQFHPHSSLKDLGFEPEEFVKEANYLLDKYNIKVPDDFPKPVVTKEAIYGEGPVSVYHTNKVGVCFCNCVQLERKYIINTSKLLSDLIKPDPVAGLLHSTSISVIAIGYSDIVCRVELFPETKTARKPDLLIDDVACDVKVLQKSDWTKEALESEHIEEMLTTGMGPPHAIRNDICFDIGMFIKERGSDGIQQADMLMADLSEKSLGNLHMTDVVQQQVLPPPKSNRIVFFSWAFYHGTIEFAYYLDFDPSLWQVIKDCDITLRRVVSPPPGSEGVVGSEGIITG